MFVNITVFYGKCLAIFRLSFLKIGLIHFIHFYIIFISFNCCDALTKT